ncbi:hypothetical protein RB608_26315 [Nocardioides sp. LHD-245]|uniref:hypothetical protein n=1 Tax=Nocardioides sp. LHD-245 TaxID=3051387 RepID=UPI0027E02A31|nr:hypothetical protein [Nocardioides sp. LHD-245]
MNLHRTAFAMDLANDLQDRHFRRAFRWVSLRIAVVDLAVNAARGFSRRRGRGG